VHHGSSVTTFESLFEAEYRRVVAIAYRVLGEPHEAEDVAQEVFCQFQRQHDPGEPFAGPWLHAAAAHAALNVVRGRRRRAQREAADAHRGQRLREATELSLDPEEAALRAEKVAEVQAALRRLPSRSAEALVLRYGGLSYMEVAAALHLKVDQVGTLLRRAEAALRKEFHHDAPS